MNKLKSFKKLLELKAEPEGIMNEKDKLEFVGYSYIMLDDLFDFFWNNWGQYYKYLSWGLTGAVKEAKKQVNENRKDDWHNLNDFEILYAQMFLFCVDIDKKRVQQKIKEWNK